MVASGIVNKVATSLGHFPELFEKGAEAINAIGGAILLISCLGAIAETLALSINQARGKHASLLFGSGESSLDVIRLNLGKMLAYSLEVLVAADIIDTLTKPAHAYKLESLYKIGLVVVIRTVLSYFLGKEMEEIEHSLSKKKAHFN